MDERRLVHPDLIQPDIVPDACSLNEPAIANWAGGYQSSANPACWDAFSSAEQQEQQADLLAGKTGIEVSSSSCRSRSPVTASKSLRSMACSLRLRPR